ncbi:ferredoxin reductase [Streptomyces sp. SID8379]|uniref:ferredoxin reductase n=1 Tax=unclassified Streptomyces TaxID=2593676 RepID=UPI00036968FA|nr:MULTISPECIES: ferredoxin reductase [unclassified Streptomyces]MYW65820.1 ferredoxin reductase [Streptomyces sp. SID8379]
MSVHPWSSREWAAAHPRGWRWPGGRAALATASWLTSPLSPDDYLGLLDPLWSARHPAGRITAVRPEGPAAVTLAIRPGRGWRGHRAGQYLPLGVEIDGVRHWRTYSLTSPPDGGSTEVTVTVKAHPDGRVSPHLVHRARPGTVLRLGPAQGEFVLPEPLPERLLFVTAGSGITPVMAMLRALARRPGTAPDILLLHSAPTPADCLFRTELRFLESRLPRLAVHLTHTRTAGRLTADRIAAHCPDWRDRDTWVCGPAGLLDAAERQWAAAGARERLRVERFHLTPARAVGEDTAGGRVRFERSGVSTEATGAEPLLAVGEAAGVPMPHGCRRGLCFGCLVPLLDGRIRDLRTGELHGNPGELIQTCVNGAAGPLVLDL